MASKFRNSGQTCVCANRIYIQEGIYDAVSERVIAEVARLKVGDGRQSEITQGPLIDEAAIEKVQSHIEDAVSKGASIRTGGKRLNQTSTFLSQPF